MGSRIDPDTAMRRDSGMTGLADIRAVAVLTDPYPVFILKWFHLGDSGRVLTS